MGDRTGIEWTDATWNPLRGCSRVSEACRNCYAEILAGRFSGPGLPYEGLAKRIGGEPRWTGEVRFVESALTHPLLWKKPRRIFVNSMSDLFHEKVPDEWIDRIFAVMALAPQHTFQILTKRPGRMQKYFMSITAARRIAAEMLRHCVEWNVKGVHVLAALKPRQEECDPEHVAWPLPNVWLGVSVEDQKTAEERIWPLRKTPAVKRFISVEPMLGNIDLNHLQIMQGDAEHNALETTFWSNEIEQWRFTSATWKEDFLDWYGLHKMPSGIMASGLDWVICGGESGPNARPMHPDWARSLRDQCAAASVPFFFKQWGKWLPDYEDAPNRPDDNSEQSRFKTCVWDAEEGKWDETNGHWADSDYWYSADNYSDPEQPMTGVGKRAAGSLLDGREHKDFPA